MAPTHSKLKWDLEDKKKVKEETTSKELQNKKKLMPVLFDKFMESIDSTINDESSDPDLVEKLRKYEGLKFADIFSDENWEGLSNQSKLFIYKYWLRNGTRFNVSHYTV